VVGETKSEEAKRALKAWLERPGAEERSLAARTRGTYLHTQAENWILGNPTHHHLVFGGYWRSLHRWLEDNFHSALGVEFPIWHAAGFSGTADCLGWTYDSTDIQLIDWKTSVRYRDPNSEMMRGGYYIQLAAYRAGIRHTYGIEVNSAQLVIARQLGAPDIYTLNKELLDECEEEFFYRLRRFQEVHGHVLA
jgi:ATP-dependent exoDNAse (exonuclease V) beta subunit